MKWLGLPLLLLLVLNSPATLAGSCAGQSMAVDTTCSCCSGPDSCCLDSNASADVPVKNSLLATPEFPTLAAAPFTLANGFTPLFFRRVQRYYPPLIQVRPPPDPATLCTFLI